MKRSDIIEHYINHVNNRLENSMHIFDICPYKDKLKCDGRNACLCGRRKYGCLDRKDELEFLYNLITEGYERWKNE